MKIIVNGIKIKTNKYAGNFEREMTAYCTGRIGDCEVGNKEAKIFIEENGTPLDSVDEVSDECGTYRPVVLDDDPNNLIIIFYDGYKIPVETCDMILRRAKEYGDKNDILIEGLEVGEFTLSI